MGKAPCLAARWAPWCPAQQMVCAMSPGEVVHVLAPRTLFPMPAAAPVLPSMGTAGLQQGRDTALPAWCCWAQPLVPESVGAPVPHWRPGRSLGPQSHSPHTGPRVLSSPEGAAGSCLPSSAWLNLNQARLLHQSLPAGDKDGLARPGPGEECCPAWDSAPVEHPAWAACPSGSAPPASTGPR